MISVEKVSKKYILNNFKTKKALDDVSFSVKEGEIFGFLGPNGAGKTTLIKILTGLIVSYSGQCKISGIDCRNEESRRKLGYLPENSYYHMFLTGREFLRFHGTLNNIPNSVIKSRVHDLLKEVQLTGFGDDPLRTYSKGMLTRIGIAQALLHDPDVLVLDEPMSGLDPVGRREVRELITKIAKQGKTVFFSTHILYDVEVICSSIGFISGGKLIGCGNLEELLGKTVKSVEVRYELPENKKAIEGSAKTMDGWVLTLEAPKKNDKYDHHALEADIQKTVSSILNKDGSIKSIIPRKNTLEELFFK